MKKIVILVLVSLTLIFSNLCYANMSISAVQAKNVMFNAVYYANKYSDLKNTFGYNSDRLYEHYCRYGIEEGRSASPIFDPKYYLENNIDLKRAFGNNYRAAYQHWIDWGCAEGRESSPYYNGKYYRNKYEDLEKAFFYNGSSANSYYRLALHYLEWGIGERRQANLNGKLPDGFSKTSVTGSDTNKIANALSWLDGNLGRTIGVNHQCVSTVKAYAERLGLPHPVDNGNACDYAYNKLNSGWTRVENGVPQAGDILVYRGAKYGHVAIYAGNNIIYESNMSDKVYGNNLRKRNRAYNKSWYSSSEGGTKYYWGYIRPNV